MSPIPISPALLGSESDIAALNTAAATMRSWDLNARQLCDLEMLLNGGYAPLPGYMARPDYERVLSEMRLADGTVWPLPVVLDVNETLAATVEAGQPVALRDAEGVLLAVLDVTDKWQADRAAEAQAILGTTDERHPGVHDLLHNRNPVYLGGRVRGAALPTHYDFPVLRQTPAEVRASFARRGWRRVAAFLTRNPLHRLQYETTTRGARLADANLLVLPIVGPTQPDDVDLYTRLRCWEEGLCHFPEDHAEVAALPLAMRLAGPREALMQAIVARNYGCTHVIVGPHQGGAVRDEAGKPFYAPEAAKRLLDSLAGEIGIEVVAVPPLVYSEDRAQFIEAGEARPDERIATLTGPEARRRMRAGIALPEWYSFPEVIAQVMRNYPPRTRQGFTVFFTGLSGSGKSTVAHALIARLREIGGRSITLLDGDIVRKHLSSELGFSHEHRDLNIRRIGFVAAEITRHGGVAVCAPIAPYAATRRQVRAMVEAAGGFFEIYVATPIEECERRDRKGLYARARAGLVKEFTGVSDPYEVPDDAEIVIDTRHYSPLEAAQLIVTRLENEGYLA
jgi:sulfate adenylyltransferase